MAGFNKAILIGYMGEDPKPLSYGAGKEGSKFSFATSRKDKDGKDITQWHNILVWSENDAKYANAYAKKGHMVLIEGEIQYVQEEYQGATRYYTNIVVGFGGRIEILTPKGESGGTARARGGPAGYREQSGGRAAPPPRDLRDDLDDEIPF